MDSTYRVLGARSIAVIASQPISFEYLYRSISEGRRADIVHLHVPNVLAALAALFLGKKTKLIVHWHSDIIGKGIVGWLVRPLERAMLKRANRVICTSQPYAEGSDPLNPFLDKVVIVPIGVPAPDSAATPLPYDLDSWIGARRVVLAVGRLVPYKGFEILLEAVSQLPEDVVVVIVGAGPLDNKLRAQIHQTHLSNKVLLAGGQSDAALHALFRRASVFCLPSVERSEAFGIVLLEAMSHGLPIVATRIPGSGVPWVNQDGVGGLNVAPRNSKALGLACAQILSSEILRRQLARGARLRFEQEFTNARFIENLLDTYSQVLGGKTCPRSDLKYERISSTNR